MNDLNQALETVATKLPEREIDCLLIGGFAVNHYGYTRNTLDIDFMIDSQKLDSVRKVMMDAGFTNIDIHDNVAFFWSSDSTLRIDFLRVNTSTIDKLLADASVITLHGCKLKIPSLINIIAMKIFSLSQNKEKRMGKDLPDIAYLAVINKLNLEQEIKPLCSKFGNDDIYRMICNHVKGITEE